MLHDMSLENVFKSSYTVLILTNVWSNFPLPVRLKFVGCSYWNLFVHGRRIKRATETVQIWENVTSDENLYSCLVVENTWGSYLGGSPIFMVGKKIKETKELNKWNRERFGNVQSRIREMRAALERYPNPATFRI